MAFEPGYKAVVKVDNAAGTLTDISAYCSNVSFPHSADSLDKTTFGNTGHRKMGGLKDGSFSFDVKWDPIPDALLDAIIGLVGSVEYGPHGSTTGNVKYTFEALCQSYEPGSAVEGMVEGSAQFEMDGVWTRGVY